MAEGTNKKMFQRLKYFVSASFIGILIGLVGLYYTLRDRETHMSVDIAAESNVLDVLHPISDLAIVFQGQDIEKQKSNLKVLSIRLINDGQTNIHEDDFDSRIPFGIQVDGGLVVRAQVTGASSPYLGENLHPRLSGQNAVLLDKIIFDKGSSVTIEVLVIHKKEQQPRVSALGKIAGLEKIAVTTSFQGHEQPSFWAEVFQGNPAVQIMRILSYAFAALICVACIGFLIGGIASLGSRLQRARRRKWLSRLPLTGDAEKIKKRNAIGEIYIEDGLFGLLEASRELKEEVKLKATLRDQSALIQKAREMRSGRDRLDENQMPRRFLVEEMRLMEGAIKPLREAGLLRLDGDLLFIDPEVKQILESLIEKLN